MPQVQGSDVTTAPLEAVDCWFSPGRHTWGTDAQGPGHKVKKLKYSLKL